MKNHITGLNGPISREKLQIILIAFFILLLSPLPAQPSGDTGGASKDNSPKPVLVEATMCEEIKDGLPLNQSVLFSIEKGKVLCFSTFGDIPERTTIFHKWFFRDKLIYKIKLSLNPPRWSTYSSIKLRDTDRGPWRVEITDQQNNIYRILRFSIAD